VSSAPATAKGRATRVGLLHAAQGVLREAGTLESSDVAETTGVAQSVIYHYFGTHTVGLTPPSP
jgi:hypothetical protein